MYTPAAELPFAGHPLVGIAWLLASKGVPVTTLKPSAGVVGVRQERELLWIRARLEWCATWTHLQLESVVAVDSATGAPEGHDHMQIWAFENEQAASARVVFAPRFGVSDDEACGSASMMLAASLRRPLTIHPWPRIPHLSQAPVPRHDRPRRQGPARRGAARSVTVRKPDRARSRHTSDDRAAGVPQPHARGGSNDPDDRARAGSTHTRR
jgi:predicted PhzF superfamily epimerase YddE/YHI9